MSGGAHHARPGDVGFEPREVYLLAKALGEGSSGAVAVVARSVKSVVDGGLDAPPNGLDKGEGDERGRGHCKRLALRDAVEDRLEPHDHAANTTTSTPVTRTHPIVG